LLRRPFASKAVNQSSPINPPLLDTPDRLTEILERLETLRKEQDELLKEVKRLAKEQKNE
jgi:hypothetical protein